VAYFLGGACRPSQATKLLIPMDGSQRDHLKAYGIAFWTLGREASIEWLLNYRGGSFLIDHFEDRWNRNVHHPRCNLPSDRRWPGRCHLAEISDPEVNMEVVKLEKAPKIAVYAPERFQPWDDAVALVMTYAEIPYERIYDKQIIAGVLPQYDWLHLHHEDFTGQYGKFYRMYRNAPWYQARCRRAKKWPHRWVSPR
jgi:hypothetical protein